GDRPVSRFRACGGGSGLIAATTGRHRMAGPDRRTFRTMARVRARTERMGEGVVMRLAGRMGTTLTPLFLDAAWSGGCDRTGSPGVMTPEATSTTSRISKSGPATSMAASTETRWTPAPGLSWQYQLSGSVDITVDAQVFDID